MCQYSLADFLPDIQHHRLGKMYLKNTCRKIPTYNIITVKVYGYIFMSFCLLSYSPKNSTSVTFCVLPLGGTLTKKAFALTEKNLFRWVGGGAAILP